jgi:RIO kinase 1
MSRNSDIADMEAIQEFIDEGLVREVLAVVKSGKEATVYRCRADPSLGTDLVAAKVYHSGSFRNFSNAATYDEGRVIGNKRTRRAVDSRTEFGREAQGAIWVDYEFEALSTLYEAGADVPEPFACTGSAVLLEFIGDEDGPAVQLQHADVPDNEARDLAERLFWNIELWLNHNVVHADLSAFNILYRPGRLTAIDFPQAVDPRFNPRAKSLLERDIRNVAGYWSRHGAQMDAVGIAAELWERWRYGELG